MGLRQLLSRTRDELTTAEAEIRNAEEAAKKAEADRARAEAERDKEKQVRKSWKERVRSQLDTAVMVGASVPAATGARAVRKRVNLKVAGVDLGGVGAVGAFIGAVVTTGKKYGAAVAGFAAGLACEFALNQMDPVPPPKDDKQKTSGLEDEEEQQAGALPPARRSSTLRERLRQVREQDARIDAKDVIDMP